MRLYRNCDGVAVRSLGGRAHLHALVDLDAPVVVVIQLLVNVAQRLQAEAVGLTHARRHHHQAGVWEGGGGVRKRGIIPKNLSSNVSISPTEADNQTQQANSTKTARLK